MHALTRYRPIQSQIAKLVTNFSRHASFLFLTSRKRHINTLSKHVDVLPQLELILGHPPT